MTECPIGTVKDFLKRECLGCDQGCKQCDLKNQSICEICEPGLALLDNRCFAECPDNYLKSVDGTVCEARTYPLDEAFVVFPFCGTALFFFMITMASYWLTGNRSLIYSSLIAFFGPIEMAACLY